MIKGNYISLNHLVCENFPRGLYSDSCLFDNLMNFVHALFFYFCLSLHISSVAVKLLPTSGNVIEIFKMKPRYI